MKLVPILDNGHGGIINNIYQTAGKRSPNWDNGVLFEGVYNRWVINRIKESLARDSIPFYHVSPEDYDISLNERVKRTNDIFSKNKEVYLLSIHANAGDGKGIEGFTSIGNTKSDLIASIFLKDLEDLNINKIRKDTTDGDDDKEANYQILKYSNCSAILLELGFMDNKEDYLNLWSLTYLETIINSLTNTIKKLYNNEIK